MLRSLEAIVFRWVEERVAVAPLPFLVGNSIASGTERKAGSISSVLERRRISVLPEPRSRLTSSGLPFRRAALVECLAGSDA